MKHNLYHFPFLTLASKELEVQSYTLIEVHLLTFEIQPKKIKNELGLENLQVHAPKRTW
jgi:hypothetical protein